MSSRNYQITIGYRAVINIDVKAESEDDAKEIALNAFNAERNKWYLGKKNHCSLADDSYSVHGIIDMDSTWNILYD